MQIKAYQLDNGIKVVHQYVPGASVSHCGLVLKLGSRDESAKEHGLVHLMEHCLFKGTDKRKAYHVLSRLDAVGGELNAYTTKEEMCIYASFINEYYERAFELIADITFNSTFPQKEIEKEKDVITDEILSYLDNPVESIFEDFETYLYPENALGRTILGSEESVKQFTTADIKKFLERELDTNQIVFSSVGNIPMKKFDRLVEKYLKNVPSKKGEESRTEPGAKSKFDKVEKRSISQVHNILGKSSVGLNSDKRKEMVLISNVLGGGGMNNRLNMNIREKYGITYSIEANYTPFEDVGIFNVYYSCEQKNHERILDLTRKEIKQFQKVKMSPRQFDLAKKQLKGHIALSNDSFSGLMLSTAKSYLYFDKIDTIEEVYQKIDQITTDSVIEVANSELNLDLFSQLTFIPES